MIRWCMVPEIWCVTDVIIFHFGPFFALLPLNSPKNKNFEKLKKTSGGIIILHIHTKNYDQMCTVPEIRCMTYVIIFHFVPFFAFLPPIQPEKSKFWKIEIKTPGHIIILDMCPKNYWSDDLQFLRYGVWDM